LKKVCKIHLSQNLNNDLVFIGNVTLHPKLFQRTKAVFHLMQIRLSFFLNRLLQ